MVAVQRRSRRIAMPLVLGLDLGTTTITALALDVHSGAIVARLTLANGAEIVGPQTSGRSEWDAERIAAAALEALHRVADAVADRASELAGIGLSGQQHGVLLVDPSLKPQGPFINWQDRRAEEIAAGTGQTWLALARDRAGEDSRQATGCSLAAGYMGVTLFWMQSQGLIRRGRTACFLVDYLAVLLTGGRIVTDATSAASSGLFAVCAACSRRRTAGRDGPTDHSVDRAASRITRLRGYRRQPGQLLWQCGAA